jgi:UDP-galactopyranose mutase
MKVLIIGSGLFGSVVAHQLTSKHVSCTVLDQNQYVGGNCHSSVIGNIPVHDYGPHIFHTSDVEVWNFINQFSKFRRIHYHPMVCYRGKYYSFPINLMTLYQVFGVNTPSEALKALNIERVRINQPSNLEEYLLSSVGTKLYEMFYLEYTTKQWGTNPRNLPPQVGKRVPIRMTFNDSYYYDNFVGVPEQGYTSIFDQLLQGSELLLGIDYFKERNKWKNYDVVVYTGKLDQWWGYDLGKLEYRSMVFVKSEFKGDYQGTAVVNYTGHESWTRIVEYKHLIGVESDKTVCVKEFPISHVDGENIPSYPLSTYANNSLADLYRSRSQSLHKDHIYFGGRLATYRYLDMHQVVREALDLSNYLVSMK